jgi:putative transposase
VRGKKIRTTVADPGHVRAGDLLNRDFTAQRPNRTWVADFTHVATWSGVVYVAFVVDVYSRAIVGWSAATNKRTPLVLAALDMGLWRRDRAGQPIDAGLVHHSDAGSQGGFNRSSQHLVGRVKRWAVGRGRSGFGSIGGKFPRRVDRRWRGVRTGSSSGLRSVAV